MALSAKIETSFGEKRAVYVRVNSMIVSNHGLATLVLYRGFLSAESFKGGSSFVWELEAQVDLDVSLPLWDQAYAHLKTLPEFADATDC